jgi:hypothetical protein
MPKAKPITAPVERPRGGRARAVSEIVPEIGRIAFRRFGFVQSSVVSRWREIVGERYADVSVPESIRFPQGQRQDGTLTLLVQGAQAPMMSHVTGVIIERVNRFFGYSAVAKVVIRQGTVPKRSAVRTAPRALVAMPVELGQSLKTIADPELKAVLESLARGVASATTIPVIGKIS